jgi:hypothetical protein
MGAVTPGKPVTLYKTGVGYNKTKKHTPPARLSRTQKSLDKTLHYSKIRSKKTARIRLIFLISFSRNRNAQGGGALEVALL